MDQKKRIIKLLLQNIAVIVMLIIISVLYALYRGGSSVEIAFSGDQISFPDYSGEEVVICYADIISIELLDALDYGEPQDGAIENNTRVGTWKSGDLGVYITHTSTHIESCLLIQTAHAAYTVNYESEETTALLLEELSKYLQREPGNG